jgi:hypothetical protein
MFNMQKVEFFHNDSEVIKLITETDKRLSTYYDIAVSNLDKSLYFYGSKDWKAFVKLINKVDKKVK